ncbi:flagellar motor protein MotB [Candidatus Sumerlaeota bacterium]|nr:flagellar motor protein MotB [Candidatus Sumerlaeota bacterium]
MLKQTMTMVVALGLFFTAGCAQMHDGKDGEKSGLCAWLNAHTGTLIGAGGGAGVGAIVAEAVTGVTMAQGLGVGALAGGLVGSLIGNHVQVECLKDDIARLTRERDDLAARLKTCEAEKADLKAEIERLKARIADLERQLANCGKKELARASIPDNVLFAPGKDKLTDAGKHVLDSVADQLKRQYPDKTISIEGHTDSVPIKHSHWKSNWELGAARSLAVLHYLNDKHGVTGVHLTATTYGEYRPVAPNDSKEGKAKNRRTEIVVLSE